MACNISEEDILQYADAELPAEQAVAVETHLRSCGVCTARVAQALQLKRSIRLAGMRYTPSSELRSRVRATVARRSSPRPWLAALAFAALVLVTSAIAVSFFTSRAMTRQAISGIVDRHVSAIAAANPVEVVSSDRHTVKPWFQGKLPFTFNLPELNGSPYVLEGGRLTFLNHSPGAHLIYDLRLHHISVFIFQERDVPVTFAPSSSSSFTVETWKQEGLRYFVVSDGSAVDIRPLIDLLKKAGKV
jgi:anti-sigma factor RsiW